MKTKLIMLVLACMPAIVTAQPIDEGWFEVGNSSYNATLASVFYTDENTGFVVGSGGAFVKTTDGGFNWTAYHTGFNYHFEKVVFTSKDKGFLFGRIREGNNHFTIILKRSDGGDTWEEIIAPGRLFRMNDVHFPHDFNENNTAYMATAGTRSLYKTADGGDTWQLAYEDRGFANIQFFSASVGIATYHLPIGRQLARTTDGGLTWTDFSIDGLGTCYAMHVVNGSVAYVSSTNRISYTTDAGLTWSKPFSVNEMNWQTLQLHFNSENAGYRFDHNGVIFHTSDRGETWTQVFNESQYPANGMFTRTSGRVDFVSTGGAVFSSDGKNPFVMRTKGIVNGALNDVWFFNENNGTAVGDNGTVLQTHNAGTSWTESQSGIDSHLTSLFFTAQDVGYASGSRNVIKTMDGGKTWSLSQTGIHAIPINSVVFTSVNKGFTVGLRTHMTEDGGATWTVVDDLYGIKVQFVDENNGYIIGGMGHVRKTTNAGLAWQNVSTGTNYHLAGLYFLSPEKGFVAGSNSRIFQTLDGGESWTVIFDGNITHNIIDIYFFNENTGYAVGSQGLILKTSDGGETWQQVRSNTIRDLVSITSAPDGTPFIVGHDGIVLRKMPSYTLTFRVEDDNQNPVDDAVITLNGVPYPVGHYSFPGLITDEYKYSVTKPGYSTESGTVSIDDQDVTVNVVLTPRYKATFYVYSDYYKTPVEGANIELDEVGFRQTNASGMTIFENLMPDGEYPYEITADHFRTASGTLGIGQSDKLIEVSMHANLEAPEATEATEVAINGFHANWKEVATADAYLVFVSPDDFVSHLADGLRASGTTLAVTGADPGTKYKYRLKAINQYGVSVFSNVVEVTTVETGTPTDNLFDEQISLYPNPAQGRFTIAGLQNNSKIEVFSMTGTKVMHVQNLSGDRVEIDGSGLVDGLYFIHISFESGMVCKKVLINR